MGGGGGAALLLWGEQRAGYVAQERERERERESAGEKIRFFHSAHAREKEREKNLSLSPSPCAYSPVRHRLLDGKEARMSERHTVDIGQVIVHLSLRQAPSLYHDKVSAGTMGQSLWPDSPILTKS